MPLSRVLPFFFNRAARANVGVGFIPILQGFKGYFFLRIRRDSGAFPLEYGDKTHPIGFHWLMWNERSLGLNGRSVIIQYFVSGGLTHILFSVWSLTVPCKRITFACTSSSRHWVDTILSSVPRLRSLRSLSLGLLRVCLFEAPCVIPHQLISEAPCVIPHQLI